MRRLGLLSVAIVFAATGWGGMTTINPALAAEPTVDISGQWVGVWNGADDVDGKARRDDATARLVQNGAFGTGRLALHTTGVAQSMPEAVIDAGLMGFRVEFEVSGSQVVMRHLLGGRLFTADFTVEGDRMIGSLRDTSPTVKVVLTRVKPPEAIAAAPEPPVAPPAAPAPAAAPAPEPVAPEPPKAPEPVAAAPAAPPAEPVQPVPVDFEGVDQVKPVHFDFDKDAIRPEDSKILDANAEWLKAHAEMLVRVEGYCDERGTADYNMALGERRARAARDYLISNGVGPERISIVSFGNERRLCMEATEDCRAQNRRATFVVKPR